MRVAFSEGRKKKRRGEIRGQRTWKGMAFLLQGVVILSGNGRWVSRLKRDAEEGFAPRPNTNVARSRGTTKLPSSTLETETNLWEVSCPEREWERVKTLIKSLFIVQENLCNTRGKKKKKLLGPCRGEWGDWGLGHG